MNRKYNDELIPLKVVRKVYDGDPNAEGVKLKCKKVTTMIEYFDKYEICKLEPTLNSVTLRKSKTRCMIFYKPNNTYYEIAESLNEVHDKISREERPRQIGFQYKNQNKPTK